LQVCHASMFRSPNDGLRYLDNVCGQNTIPNRVFGDKPEQIRPLEEIVERVADLVAKPGPRRLQSSAEETGMRGYQVVELSDVPSVDRRHRHAKEIVEDLRIGHDQVSSPHEVAQDGVMIAFVG